MLICFVTLLVGGYFGLTIDVEHGGAVTTFPLNPLGACLNVTILAA